MMTCLLFDAELDTDSEGEESPEMVSTDEEDLVDEEEEPVRKKQTEQTR
jgi:hypothetical protein